MSTATLPRVALRPLAIPNEHGGWGFLLEPAVLAIALVPSRAGVALAMALVAAFFLRHPLRLASRDVMLRKRYPRTVACAKLAAIYGAIAAGFFALAIAWSSAATMVPLVAVVPFLAAQFVFDVRNDGRALTAELCGAVAAAGGGAACALAGQGGATLAIVVATLSLARSIPSVLYVRSLLRHAPFAPAIAAHVLAIAIVGVIADVRLTIVPLALLARCIAARFRLVTARRVGLEEVGWGIVATIVWALLLTLR